MILDNNREYAEYEFVSVPDLGGTTFLVARRELDEDEDVITLTPVHYVAGVPDGVNSTEMKMYLDKSGEADVNGWNWKEYRLIPQDKWGEANWSQDPTTWFTVSFSDDLASGTSAPWLHGTTYETLARYVTDERRITLRLPVGLHVALSRAAKDSKVSLNSFCLKMLANAVGYEDSLEEFEAQRRKPGRPRKVEAAN